MFNFLTSPTTGSVRWSAGALLAGWVVIHAGCAGANDAAPVALAGPPQVRQLIGDAACTIDADCRTIAVGDKACGGPESYLAWSARQTDPQALAAAVGRYTSERKAQNRQSAMVSNCAFVTDPGARCEPARGGGGGGGAGAGAGEGAGASVAAAGAQGGRCVLRRGGSGIRAN